MTVSTAHSLIAWTLTAMIGVSAMLPCRVMCDHGSRRGGVPEDRADVKPTRSCCGGKASEPHGPSSNPLHGDHGRQPRSDERPECPAHGCTTLCCGGCAAKLTFAECESPDPQVVMLVGLIPAAPPGVIPLRLPDRIFRPPRAA